MKWESIAAIATVVVLFAGIARAVTVVEDWNDGNVDGWLGGNTVAVAPSGGPDGSPYLGVTRYGTPYVGAYPGSSGGAFSGNLESTYGDHLTVNFDWKDIGNNISNQILYIYSGGTNWRTTLGNPPNAWLQRTFRLNTNDASPAGWTQTGALSWGDTLRNVTAVLVDTSNTGATSTFGLDNFGMSTTPRGSVFEETWNDGYLDGWLGGDTVTVPSSGGVDDSPYLSATRSGSPYVGAYAVANPSGGAFSGDLDYMYGENFDLSFYLKNVAGTIRNVGLFINSGSTTWKMSLSDPTTDWAEYSLLLNTETTPAGWSRIAGSASWEDTLKNVSYVLLDTGASSGTLGVDNFRMAWVPEPGTFVLMGLGALGLVLLGVRRRR